jgi:hypothetical protein
MNFLLHLFQLHLNQPIRRDSTYNMAAEQQVTLTDLAPIQLQEVKKQLDQVSCESRYLADKG